MNNERLTFSQKVSGIAALATMAIGGTICAVESDNASSPKIENIATATPTKDPWLESLNKDDCQAVVGPEKLIIGQGSTVIESKENTPEGASERDLYLINHNGSELDVSYVTTPRGNELDTVRTQDQQLIDKAMPGTHFREVDGDGTFLTAGWLNDSTDSVSVDLYTCHPK